MIENSGPLDLLTEDTISMKEAAKVFPGKPSPATLWRWATRGVGGVKLEVIKSGGKTFTSRQAINRFLVSQQ